MSSLLVIGGTGYFGKSILDAFGRNLLQPWGITKLILMARNTEILKAQFSYLLNENVELISADIGSCSVLPQADYVIHAAASTDAAAYLSRPQIERENILAGTYNYCRLAKDFHKNSHVLYVSSGAVYGAQPTSVVRLQETNAFLSLEDVALGKRDYTAAKRDAERAIAVLGESGVRVSVARCFAFVGAFLPRDKHFAIGNFLADGMAGRPVSVSATHPVFRSYMYSDDLVKWLMTILFASKVSCPIFNVGSDEAVSIIDLAHTVAKFFNVPVNAPPQHSQAVDRYIPSVSKAKQELHLSLDYSLSDAIRETTLSIVRENG